MKTLILRCGLIYQCLMQDGAGVFGPSFAFGFLVFIAFAVFFLLAILTSLSVYERQALLNIHYSSELMSKFDRGGQKTSFSLLMTGIPPHLRRNTAPVPRRRRCRRSGKRGGQMVSLKAYLTCHHEITFIPRVRLAELGSLQYHFVP